MNEIKVNDLKKGDILLFKGDKEEWISLAIMLFTDSDVSHAALYLDDNSIADEGLAGLGKHTISDDPNGFFVYVNRLSENVPSMDPVIEAAAKYIIEGEPYCKSSLILLAMIILYKKFTPPSPAKKIISKIFIRASERIVEIINKRMYPGKTPMICSQFVFQCYEDCGRPYNLKIKNGSVYLKSKNEHTTSSFETKAVKDNSSESILDNLIKSYTAEKRPLIGLSSLIPVESDESLAQQLVETFSNIEAVQSTTADNLSDQEFNAAALKLCNALALYHGSISSDTINTLSLLKQHSSYFVTPADLKSHCMNVTTIGTASIHRKL